MILDCDFCPTAQHFQDKIEPINQGWNWMETGYEDGSEFKTVACPKHDASKISELDEKKKEIIEYTESDNSEQLRTDSAQGSLIIAVGGEDE